MYQLGNLFAAPNANLQVWIASWAGSDLRWALAGVIAVVAVTVAGLVMLGRDTRDVKMGRERIGQGLP